MNQQQAAQKIAENLHKDFAYRFAFDIMVIIAIIGIIFNLLKLLQLCEGTAKRRMFLRLRRITLFNKRKLQESITQALAKLPPSYMTDNTTLEFEQAFTKFSKDLTFEEFSLLVDDLEVNPPQTV